MSRQTIAVSVKASKLTARALAYVVAAVGRKIAKEHRKAQTPHGKLSGRKLMGHGVDTNAIEVDTLVSRTAGDGRHEICRPGTVYPPHDAEGTGAYNYLYHLYHHRLQRPVLLLL